MPLTERLAIVLETVGTTGVVRDLQKVANASEGLGGKVKAVGGQLRGTLVGALPGMAAAAGTALVAFSAKSVDAFQETALAALDMSRATGATIEQSSAMIAAFDDMGISAETAIAGMFQLAKRIETSGEKLAGFGVSAARGADGTVDLARTLEAVSDAYLATEDPGRRAALVNAAFGKSGQQLIPILEQGSEGIRRLYADAAKTGQIMTPEDAQRAEEFRIAMDGLSDAFREFQLESGEALVPLLTDLANAITKTADFTEKIITLGGFIDETEAKGGATRGLGGWLDSLKNKLFGVDTANEEAGASTTTLARRMREAGAAAEEEANKLDAVENATLAASSAQRAMTSASRAVTTAENNLADARDEYNKLLREGAVDEEKVADARRSLADATRSLGSAQRRLRESQEEYNEALAYFQAVGGDTAWDRLQDAQDNLADAEDGVASARERTTDAQADLDKALAGDPEFNDKLARAKRGLDDAETGLADAIYTSSQRAFELNDALTTQKTLVGDNAAQVALLRDEWMRLLALKPELLPFLASPLMGLGVKPSQIPLPPGVAGPVLPTQTLSPAQIPLPAGVAGPVLPTTTNVTVNVAATNADPNKIAREVAWSLN